MLTARGDAHSYENDPPAHKLAWVDPETGEPIELELLCDDALRNGLESIGFECAARTELDPGPGDHTDMDPNKEHATASP